MENNQQLTLTDAWSQMREFWLGLINEQEEEAIQIQLNSKGGVAEN